jgi:hypothetical protein
MCAVYANGVCYMAARTTLCKAFMAYARNPHKGRVHAYNVHTRDWNPLSVACAACSCVSQRNASLQLCAPHQSSLAEMASSGRTEAYRKWRCVS